jgi:hypothetical protein
MLPRSLPYFRIAFTRANRCDFLWESCRWNLVLHVLDWMIEHRSQRASKTLQLTLTNYLQLKLLKCQIAEFQSWHWHCVDSRGMPRQPWRSCLAKASKLQFHCALVLERRRLQDFMRFLCFCWPLTIVPGCPRMFQGWFDVERFAASASAPVSASCEEWYRS